MVKNMLIEGKLARLIFIASPERPSAITISLVPDFNRILKEEYPPILKQITEIANTKLPEIRKMLDNMGAAYTPGRIPKVE